MSMSIKRSALQGPTNLRMVLLQSATFRSHQLLNRRASSLPNVMQVSFWQSLIPKPFRRRGDQATDIDAPARLRSKEWNPATFYIVIFLLIGSMAIQMIALKRDFNTFMRRSEVRIGLLREVVEKLQKGEHVDVDKALGTGDAEREKEWEEVLKEIERDDLKSSKKNDKAKPSTPSPAKTEVKSNNQTQTTEPTKPKAASYSSFF